MKRLYVIISKELEPVYACVQGGHAVAQYLIDHPSGRTWNNDYLIYCYADVDKWMRKLSRKGYDFSMFREPDLDNKLTAIAVQDNDGKIFKNLPLIRC